MVTGEDGVTFTEIMSGIVFDRPLDPALFVLTAPEGYKVETFGVAELRPRSRPSRTRPRAPPPRSWSRPWSASAR